MARLVCVLLLLAVATACASDSRVIGGNPVDIEKHPSVVQVQRSLTGLWRYFCGGSILTSYYVLTSAGCFIGPSVGINLRRIQAGSSTRNTGGQIRNLLRVIKHDLWNEGVNREGDIAILWLNSPLIYSPRVQQATILGQDVYIPDNMPATQVGWGMTFNENFPSIFADNLKELAVSTVNNWRCAYNYANLANIPYTVTSNMLCAAAPGESSACLGDRGTPLFINDITVGIVSWGRGCSNSTFPTVHTSIPSFTNWIVANVN